MLSTLPVQLSHQILSAEPRPLILIITADISGKLIIVDCIQPICTSRGPRISQSVDRGLCGALPLLLQEKEEEAMLSFQQVRSIVGRYYEMRSIPS